jgi:hypothetical protein
VHERDVSITACTGLLEFLLALCGRQTVPVTSINIVRDDAVAERSHRAEDAAASGEVRRTHVCWLLADDLVESTLESLHLRRELGRAKRAKVGGVAPGVGGNLVTGIVGSLDCGRLVMDTACISYVNL